MGRLAVAVVVSLWSIPVSIMVDRIVPEPYMDEIFHIPQAQRYCSGDFGSWDPMITTPPGLYYLSLAYVAPLFPGMWFAKATQSFSQLCSTAILRSTNAVVAVICSVIIYDLLIHLRPTFGERKATYFALLLSLYPLHWFFTFLYYTDVASLTTALAMYLASLKRHYWVSAMLGALAILFRQTNVVWMMLIAASGAVTYAEDFYGQDCVLWGSHKITQKNGDLLIEKKNIPRAPGLRRRRMNGLMNPADINKSESSELSPCHIPGFIDEVLDIAVKLWCLKWSVLISFAPFVMVLSTFVAFVIWNGCIVLGAKESHAVSPHFAQMMYFGLVAAAALAPVHFTFGQAATLCQLFMKSKIVNFFRVMVAFLTFLMGFITVHFFSIAHPYLLADNRHYTFYIWRKVIQAHWMMKYLLVPLYVYSWGSIISILGKDQKRFWILSFVVATALVLIPAPLIEFRYYTIPFYFLVLHSKITQTYKWLIMGILYAIVNIFTLTMFLFHPFHWDHEPGTQRFIW